MCVRAEAARFNRLDLSLQRALGSGLQVEIERGVDLESLLVKLLAEFVVELRTDPLDKVGRDFAGLDARREAKWIGLRFARLGGIDDILIAHQRDDSVSPLDRPVGKEPRIVA